MYSIYKCAQVCLIKALGFGSCTSEVAIAGTSKGSSQYCHAVLFSVGVLYYIQYILYILLIKCMLKWSSALHSLQVISVSCFIHAPYHCYIVVASVQLPVDQ